MFSSILPLCYSKFIYFLLMHVDDTDHIPPITTQPTQELNWATRTSVRLIFL